MQKTYYLPKRLSNTIHSYVYLCELNEMLKQHHDIKIRLSFKATTFIQPNLLAVLGFIVESAKLNKNSIIIGDLQPQIHTLFKNYHFIGKQLTNKKHYLPYRTFNHTELQTFNLYLDTTLNYLKNHNLKLLIKSRLIELFINGVQHGVKQAHHQQNDPLLVKRLQAAEGGSPYHAVQPIKNRDREKEIFICGSINISQDWLFVTIVNRGTTFNENVCSVHPSIKAHESYACIKWAMERGNSTTEQSGLGLALLSKELYYKGGKCYCISGDAYYDVKHKKGQTLPFYLNGTIMTLAFNLKNLS